MRRLILTSTILFAASATAPAMAQYYGGYNGNNDDTIRCESNDGLVNRCGLPYGGGRVVLEKQHSRSACIEGRTWGQDRGGVWVSQGCRADFRMIGGYGNSGYYGGNGGYHGNGAGGYGQTIRCESNDGRVQRCGINTGINGGRYRVRAELVRQLSRSACIEGRSWGSDTNGVWVSQGCRGEFAVAPGGYNRGRYNGGWNASRYGDIGQLFRCESNDGRMRQCAANTRSGVQLVRQLSRSACIQGRTWGYGNNAIWVSDGCRAEFRSY